MKRPCPIKIDGCPDADSPITNVSAEAPDPLLFFGTAWPDYDPYSPPPLVPPLPPIAPVDCQTVQTVSAGSQELADLLAQALGLNCPNSGGQYANDQQSATISCANGSTATYTVPAGTLTFSTDNAEEGLAWVAYANAWASAYAYDQASAQLACITTPVVDPDAPPTNPHRGGGGEGATFASNPGWLCLGEDLIESQNTYTVGGSGEYTFAITSGSIAPGTTLEQVGSRSAAIVGQPTTAGIYTYTLTADRTSQPPFSISATDTLYVLGITNALTLPSASEGVAYGPEQLLTGGTTGAVTFEAETALPIGFSLSSDGILTSSAATVAADYTFSIKITDSENRQCTQSVSLSVTAAVCVDCDYATIFARLVSVGPGTPSAAPPWDGIFDHTIEWAPGKPIWYFLNRSLQGIAVSADQFVGPPPYPTPGWPFSFDGIELDWSGTEWRLYISGCDSGSAWWFGVGSSVNPLDPSGIYTYAAGPSVTIDKIQVNPHGSGYCIGFAVPTTGWANPQPARTRIANFASVKAKFAVGGCGAPTPGIPEWDGTFPVKQAVPFNELDYFTTDIGAPYFLKRGLNGAMITPSNNYNTGNSPCVWYVFIAGTGCPGGFLWVGTKNTGLDPTGTYIRDSGSSATPGCIEIEAY